MYEARQNKTPISRVISSEDKIRKNVILSSFSPLQRVAFIGSTLLLPKYNGKTRESENGDDVSDFKYIESSALEKHVLEDPFYRYYKNEDEFRNHTNGKPVPCGLIRNLLLWFRIEDLGKNFFVLGEGHNVINYSTIIEESNQNGNVIVEGADLPINYYKDNYSLKKSRRIANAEAYAMESILSKTYFALQNVKDENVKTISYILNTDSVKQRDNASSYNDEIDRQQADWLNTNRKIERDEFTYKIKDYPSHPSIESEYSFEITIARVISQCKIAVDNYIKELDSMGDSDYVINEYSAYNPLMKSLNNLSAISDYKKAEECCLICALLEIGRSKLPYINNMKRQANSMREEFMFKSICDANDKDFLMAGIGDEHAKALKHRLQEKNIKTILYDEFITTDYVQDAFYSTKGTVPHNSVPADASS
ncbi:hypothetical protein [Bacteroides fragilis]|uniref:hypothetical protein n=1 Tax=Bacteroides fragilis TaxID=817 RepID=UPI002454AE14|nr:hypothetical protein [Bacteroides fragilis]